MNNRDRGKRAEKGGALSLKPPKIKEADVLRMAREWLKMRGWFVVRIQQSMGAHKGVSDLIAVKRGLTVWMEIKGPNGRLSKPQEEFAAAIDAAGGFYAVIRNREDLENVSSVAKEVKP